MNLESLAGPERFLVSPGENFRKMQLAVDKIQRVEWIRSLAPWKVMATFTFRYEASKWSARKSYEKVMAKRLPRVSYVLAIEANPGRDGYHIHSLWADCDDVWRKDEWSNWSNRYGRARIEPVRSENDVSGYASKYLLKEDGDFDVKLQWHRLQQVRGFVLDQAQAGNFVQERPNLAPASCAARA